MTEDSAEHSEHHNDAGERCQRQPAVESRVGAVTRPARGDLQPVESAVMQPQPEQQNVGGDQQKERTGTERKRSTEREPSGRGRVCERGHNRFP